MAKKSPILYRKNGLYLKKTAYKGRGVFCEKPIKRGEVVEVTPSIILNDAATDHADETILLNYTFGLDNVSKKTRDLSHVKKVGRSSVLIMGVSAFCNHDENHNAEILWEEQDGKLHYTLRATKNIPKDTEICTDYGDGWFEDRE